MGGWQAEWSVCVGGEVRSISVWGEEVHGGVAGGKTRQVGAGAGHRRVLART